MNSLARSSALGLRRLYRRPNFFSGERQVLDSDAYRIMNRVGYRRRHRDDWSLTDAHAVVRSAAHRSLDDDLTQPRDIANAGNLVIAEVERRHLAVGKEQFFGQCVACSHDNAAVDLAVVQKRIKHLAGMMSCDEATELDLTALRIDLDFRHLTAHGSLRPDLVILIMAFDDDRRALGLHNLAV